MDKICLALVTIEGELWGVEKVRLGLSSAGYRVVAVRSWEAVGVIKRIQPNLIIANLAGDRPEDLQLCKSLAKSSLAPLVVIGSQVHSSYILAMFEAGITDYLSRPVNQRELVARVRNILHRTQLPLQIHGTAVDSEIQINNVQKVGVPLFKALRNLAGRLARGVPQRSS